MKFIFEKTSRSAQKVRGGWKLKKKTSVGGKNSKKLTKSNENFRNGLA